MSAVDAGFTWGLTRLRKGQCLRRQGGPLQSLAKRLRRLGGLLGQARDFHGGMLIRCSACY